MNIFNVPFCCIVVIIFMKSGHIRGSYYVFDKETRWNGPRDNCSFATPLLQFSSKRLTYSVDDNLQTVLENTSEDLWIGYYVAFTGFQYIGCVHRDVIQNLSSTYVQQLGHCYVACNYTNYVGVTLKNMDSLECFCLPVMNGLSTELMNSECDGECPEGRDNNKFACGSSNGQYVSVYESMKEINVTFGRQRCVSVKNNFTFSLENCNNENIVLCQNATNKITPYTNTKSWMDAQHQCLESEMLPVSPSNIIEHGFTHKVEHWTGVVRSKVVYTYSESLELENEHRRYLYIDKDTMNIKYERIISAMRKTLCVAVPNQSTTFSTSTTSTSTKSQTPSHTTSTTRPSATKALPEPPTQNTYITTRITTIDGMESVKTTAKTDGNAASANRANDEGSSRSAAIVGGVVTAIVVIAAIGALIVLRKRGIRPFHRSSSSPEKRQHSQAHCHVNPSYINSKETNIDDDNNTNSNYFILEKEPIAADAVNATQNQTSPITPSNPLDRTTDEEEQQYSTIDNDIPVDDPDYYNTDKYNTLSSNKQPANTGNVYDKVATVEDATYNVTGPQTKGPSDDRSSDYNSTSTIGTKRDGPFKTDNVYSHLGTEHPTLFDESEYDTTAGHAESRNRQELKATDNVYNTLQTDQEYSHIQHMGYNMRSCADGDYN